MNGFQLYKKYITSGQNAGRDSEQWAYAQTLNEAFSLVGTTRLFNLLEQAEATNQRIVLQYPSSTEVITGEACTLQLASWESTPKPADRMPVSSWFRAYEFDY
ncbi:hypothetical protein CLV58_11892 [Spirosoma oryzae]|uniref:Uncharacterized protein n=1 Tax=Spirosoma oryzae TaxID=1469603 RepID=A0A2T0SLD0_9BACT|nr:hypothetical protein [Spirosoma oryzae]PRY34220.1 hypothetical protein CLV58_11892 [Spirosoma oryzae]